MSPSNIGTGFDGDGRPLRGGGEDGRFELGGFPAWLAWLCVHLVFLIGFRNKVAVLWQWAYAYFTYKRGARIITGLVDEIEP